jgi:hypothetical protein
MGARVSAGLRDILDEMASGVRDVVSSADFPVQVERGMILNPTPPTVDIYVTDPAREFSTAAFADVAGAYQITVRARVTTADNDTGQDLLISFMDDTDSLCIPLALFTDPTLNGNAASMDLVNVSGHRAYETPDGAGAHLGCQWDFLVVPVRS